jgi:hypothetical protein
MVQVLRYGIIQNPSGNRMILAAGNHAFTTNGKEVTLTISLHRLIAAHCRPNQPPTKTGAAGSRTGSICGVYPYVSSSMLFTAITKGRVIVSRKTSGGSLGAKFSYAFVGY